MQISTDCASMVSALNPLKSKEAGAEAKTFLASPEPAATDSFTATASWNASEAAGIYKKPTPSAEPLSATLETKAAADIAKPQPTISKIASDTITEAAQVPEPPTFGPQELQQLLQSFGHKNGDEGFNAKMDLNGDGLVDGSDLSVVLSNFRRAKG